MEASIHKSLELCDVAGTISYVFEIGFKIMRYVLSAQFSLGVQFKCLFSVTMFGNQRNIFQTCCWLAVTDQAATLIKDLARKQCFVVTPLNLR